MRILSLFVVLFIIVSTYTVYAESNPKIESLCDDSPSLRKVSSDLLKIRLAYERGDDVENAMMDYAPFAIREGDLQCIIGVHEITAGIINACTKSDLTMIGEYSYDSLHQIVVRCYDPHQFDSIVIRDDVLGITTEPLAIAAVGSYLNEADRTMHAIDTRTLYGVDGSGVRIGVLSDSVDDRFMTGRMFDGFMLGSPSQSRLELPKKIRMIDSGDGSGNDEGSAMMELMYDMAPGVDFSFASVKYSYAAFSQNIRKLWSDPGYECQILVDDISFLREPLYQNGPIALAAKEAVTQGVSYFSAAGNLSDLAHERPYTDADLEEDDSYPPNGKDFHDFGQAYDLASDTHLAIRLPQYTTLIVALHWDEPYGGILASGPGSESDLDLYLVSDENLPLREGTNGNILTSSIDMQGTEDDPAGEPIEFLYYTNALSERDVYLAIDHRAGRLPRLLHLCVITTGSNSGTVLDQHLLQDRTIMGHMVASDIVTVAAMPYRESEWNGEYLEPIEEWNVSAYSALGGDLPIFFSDDGMVRLDEPESHFKPSLTGPDETSTSVYGFGTFNGTSASVANVVAVAALLLQKNPTLTPEELLLAMQESAIDIETPGVDAHSGFGLVDALQTMKWLFPSSVSDWLNY